MIAKDSLLLRVMLAEKGAETYGDIEEMVGLSRRTQAKIFKHSSPVRFDTMNKIAKFLGEDVTVLDIAEPAAS